LNSEKPSAQLVAAELLCRNATRLMPYQSLHWPSAIEGTWSSGFNAKTKLLVVEALIRMTLAGPTDECALRAVAVRLYAFWDSEDGRSPDGIRVRGCIGKLLKAVIDTIKTFAYRDFIQGNRKVTFEQLCDAADSAKTNPDGFLDQLSERYARELNSWARQRRVRYPNLPNQPDCRAVLGRHNVAVAARRPAPAVRHLSASEVHRHSGIGLTRSSCTSGSAAADREP
jgi:hypothetical protein